MGAEGPDPMTLAIAIPLLGAGTYLLRYALLGLFSRRRLPRRLERALRFVPAAVLPAIAVPLLLLDGAGGFVADPARLSAAALGVAAGLWSGNLLVTIAVGMAAYWTLGAVF